MDDQTLWELMRETWLRIEERFNPTIQPFISRSNLTLREWMLILAALTFEPEDTTPSHLMVRGPYTSSDRYLEGLEKAVGVGYLDKVGEGRYRLSKTGRNAVENFIDIAREAMITNSQLTQDELSGLAVLLKRLVRECLKTSPPPDTWSIELSYKIMPVIEPAMPYIEQAISCLSAYRDDAHLAAWCSSGLSASGMESLTLIWRGQVRTFNEIVKKLKFRGHPETVYLDAIAELREREFLVGSRNRLSITEKGDQFRTHVEETTDQYFYRPWVCLSDSEKKEIATILPRL